MAPSLDRDPNAELAQLQIRQNQVADDSLDSTRRMLQLCQESEETGARTINMLGQQGEQLDDIEGGMNKIHSDVKEAEKYLTDMEKCCGICTLSCKSSSQSKEDASTWKGKNGGKVVKNQPQRDTTDGVNRQMPHGEYIQKITNDDRENEMEDNMSQVSDMLGNLRNMAIDMGSEIETQNQQIDRINQGAISNEMGISKANDRAKKLLK